jgi:hypothetical protein
MKPLPERLDEQLEREIHASNGRGPFASGLFTNPASFDPEMDELVMVARQISRAPQLRADPRFVNELERRLRRQALFAQRLTPSRRIYWQRWHMHPFLAVLTACLLVITCSTTVLTLAAQDPVPGSPLYGVRQLEQHVQYSLASSPSEHAGLDLQFARESLNRLSYDLNERQYSAYAQDLSTFEQQFATASRAIAALPSSSSRQQLSGQLTGLQSDARQTLYGFLRQLDLATGLSTTAELSQLGVTVPHLNSAQVQLSATLALIALTGSDLQAGAKLVINDSLTRWTGSRRGDQLVFMITWIGNQHFQSLGLVNPDSTIAQITSIDVKNLNNTTNNATWGNPGTIGKPGGSGGSGWPHITPTPFPPRPPRFRPTPGPPFHTGAR